MTPGFISGQEAAVDLTPSVQMSRAVHPFRKRLREYVLFAVISALPAIPCAADRDSPQLLVKPQAQIALPFRAAVGTAGGLIAHDLDGDGRRDFLITTPERIMAASQDGRILWHQETDVQVSEKSEDNGLPGHHGPGIQAGDVTGDGQVEVLYLTRSGLLHILKGASGELLHAIDLHAPAGTERWEHLAIANFRGQGDRDLLLQTTNAEGYRMGRYLAAYAIEDLIGQERPEPLWARDNFIAAAHNGARLADLDGDGRDEVVAGSLVGSDGRKIHELPIRGHVDAVQVADVLPGRPGLEVVALEERGRVKLIPFSDPVSDWLNWNLNKIWGAGNRIFLFGTDGLIWQTHHRQQEPQNAAVGEFAPDIEGLEIWNRSRYDVDQKPFVFDARGNLIADYGLSEVAPAGWSRKGVEVIYAIHWTGTGRQHAAAKERHEAGDVGVFDPMTGEFIVRIPARAERLYVADVLGDWREEIIILSSDDTLRIYSNPDRNPAPDHASLWDQPHYQRARQIWNYYSP